jgi:hypothetical protein
LSVLVTVSILDIGYYRDILAVDLLSCNMFTIGTDGEYRCIKHHFTASSDRLWPPNIHERLVIRYSVTIQRFTTGIDNLMKLLFTMYIEPPTQLVAIEQT